MLTVRESVPPEVGVALVDDADVAEDEDSLDPLGEVAVGTEKPVTLPVSGPGPVDAEAPTPAS